MEFSETTLRSQKLQRSLSETDNLRVVSMGRGGVAREGHQGRLRGEMGVPTEGG